MQCTESIQCPLHLCFQECQRTNLTNSHHLDDSFFPFQKLLFVTLNLRYGPMIFSLSILRCQFLLQLSGLVQVAILLGFHCLACLAQLEDTIAQKTSWSSGSLSAPISVMYLCHCAIHLLHVPFQPLTPTLRQLLICFIIRYGIIYLLYYYCQSLKTFLESPSLHYTLRITLYYILHYTIYQQFLLFLLNMSLYRHNLFIHS